MFIAKDSDNGSQALTEAEELKPSCEVRGGNLFVQLHFKAVKAVPDSAELINTVVTSRDESSAEFSGCGKHLVAVSSTDEETPLTRDNAVKYIKAYLGTMFGQDVGNSLKDDDIHTIDEKGEEMDAAALKKWEEQQKEKGDEGKESVDESIPSFGRFMLSESDDDVEAETASDEDEDDGGGDGEEDEDAVEGAEGEDGGDGEESEDGGDEDEDEEAGDELPPPATYLVCYMIKADGQPETDHTDSKTLDDLDPKGKLKLPGSKFNLGIEFKSGGATVDTIDLKKLSKEVRGKIDAEKLEDQIGSIFTKNFPKIPIIDRGIRDARTLIDEMKAMNFYEEDTDVRAAMQKVGNTAYSFYIQLKDNPAKPYVNKKDIIKIVNASLKQMGGRWLKFMSGVGEKDVIELHATTTIGANTKADREMVFRSVPEPEQIQNIIDGPNKRYKEADKFDAPKIWSDLAKQFKSLRDKNQKYDEHVIKKIIDVWVEFQEKHNNKPDDVTYKDFDEFYKTYKNAYDSLGIRDRLDESFLSERALMQEMFSGIYEDDGPDEEPEDDVDSFGGDGGDEGGSSGGDSGGDSGGKEDESKFQAKIFILPMKHLDKAFDRDGNY